MKKSVTLIKMVLTAIPTATFTSINKLQGIYEVTGPNMIHWLQFFNNIWYWVVWWWDLPPINSCQHWTEKDKGRELCYTSIYTSRCTCNGASAVSSTLSIALFHTDTTSSGLKRSHQTTVPGNLKSHIPKQLRWISLSILIHLTSPKYYSSKPGITASLKTSKSASVV